MRAGRGDSQAVLARQSDDLSAQPGHLAAGFTDITADRRAHFDHRFVHLPLDLILQPLLSLGEHLLDVRAQLARVRIDDLELFLDAEGEGGRGLRHGLSSLSRQVWGRRRYTDDMCG